MVVRGVDGGRVASQVVRDDRGSRSSTGWSDEVWRGAPVAGRMPFSSLHAAARRVEVTAMESEWPGQFSSLMTLDKTG